MPFCQSTRVLMFHTTYPPEAGVWAYQVNAPILESESAVCVRRLEWWWWRWDELVIQPADCGLHLLRIFVWFRHLNWRMLCLGKGCYVRENTLGLKNDIITQSAAVTKLIDVPGMNKLEYKYQAIFALLTDVRLSLNGFYRSHMLIFISRVTRVLHWLNVRT